MMQTYIELMTGKVFLYRQQRCIGKNRITSKDIALAKVYISQLEHHKNKSLYEFLEEEYRR